MEIKITERALLDIDDTFKYLTTNAEKIDWNNLLQLKFN